MIKSVNLPEIGENVESGVVVSVPLKVGDAVAVDDTVIELETDKALVEIPSPFGGRVTQILVKTGLVISVGDVIARIETEDHATNEKTGTTASGQGTGLMASAFSDMKSHVRQALSRLEPIENKPFSKSPKLPDFRRWGEIEKKEMSTVRRLTAQNTTNSRSMIPHVTHFDETDITRLLAMNEKEENADVETRSTLTAIITRTSADALRQFPQFNASIDISSNQIIFKRYIHIGIATDTPRGLLVPVIRNDRFEPRTVLP